MEIVRVRAPAASRVAVRTEIHREKYYGGHGHGRGGTRETTQHRREAIGLLTRDLLPVFSVISLGARGGPPPLVADNHVDAKGELHELANGEDGLRRGLLAQHAMAEAAHEGVR